MWQHISLDVTTKFFTVKMESNQWSHNTKDWLNACHGCDGQHEWKKSQDSGIQSLLKRSLRLRAVLQNNLLLFLLVEHVYKCFENIVIFPYWIFLFLYYNFFLNIWNNLYIKLFRKIILKIKQYCGYLLNLAFVWYNAKLGDNSTFFWVKTLKISI